MDQSFLVGIARLGQMCRTAGSAVAAIGRAIALDDSRTMSEEEGEEGEFLEAFPSAGEEGRESRKQQQRGGRRSSSLGNREPARSELLALQLVECSNEMEEHLKGEVSQVTSFGEMSCDVGYVLRSVLSRLLAFYIRSYRRTSSV